MKLSISYSGIEDVLDWVALQKYLTDNSEYFALGWGKFLTPELFHPGETDSFAPHRLHQVYISFTVSWIRTGLFHNLLAGNRKMEYGSCEVFDNIFAFINVFLFLAIICTFIYFFIQFVSAFRVFLLQELLLHVHLLLKRQNCILVLIKYLHWVKIIRVSRLLLKLVLAIFLLKICVVNHHNLRLH